MKVDFYILEGMSTLQAWHHTCHLIEKFHAEQCSIYIHVNSREEAEHLDQLLWTYREDSFLPHHIYDEKDEFPPSIQIGYHQNLKKTSKILINLAREIPAFFQQFTHISEIVFSDGVVQQWARERYRQYRELNAALTTHKLKATDL